MRVLWFPNTPSLYLQGTHHYHGTGWIESLEELITANTDIELAVAFFHPVDHDKVVRGKTTYYPILRQKPAKLKRFFINWSNDVDLTGYLKDCKSIIEDFKPDVIQVFGSEVFFAGIQSITPIPVVIHIQGILNPYMNAFYPPKMNTWNLVFLPFYFKKHLLGNSLLFDKARFDKNAVKELAYFKQTRYFMGRTHWDKSLTHLFSPKAQYFHVDEVLRSAFYEGVTWRYNTGGKVIIVSTISDTIYKGFDVILKTAELLKRDNDIDFEWRVIGVEPQSTFIKMFEYIYKKKFAAFNVVFLGKLQPTELIAALKAGSIFIHPSYIDNSPNSVCEAQMTGIPVIACNVGGLASIVKNEETGILVPANDPFQMTFQVKRLTADIDLANKLSQQGKLAALTRHNKDKILADLLSVYKTISQQPYS